MKTRKIISGTVFGVLLALYSYFTYMAFQGLLEIISRYGEKAVDFLVNVFGVFAFPGVLLFVYAYLFHEEKKTKAFYLRHGIYQAVTGGLGFVFAIVDMIKYTNWGYGPTLCYPVDFLILYILSIGLAVYCFLQKKKATAEAKKGSVIFAIALPLYLFLALDRAGATLTSLFAGAGSGFASLLPLYLLSLIPMADVVLYVIYESGSVKEDAKTKIFLIGSLATIVLSLACIGYVIGMLFGSYATPFMKIVSSFYGLDRLSSKPITISLCALLMLTAGIWSLVLYFRKAKAVQK